MDKLPTLEELEDQADEGRGLKCPYCGCGNFAQFPVKRTVRNGVFQSIRRRRACRNCGEEFYTREKVVH